MPDKKEKVVKGAEDKVEGDAGCLQSLIDSPKKYSDFAPSLKVMADRVRYSLLRRVRRYSSVNDIEIAVDDIVCDYLDVCAKDLDHDTLVYRVHSSVCDQPIIVIFDSEALDFLLGFILVSSTTDSGFIPPKKGAAHPVLTSLSSNLIDRFMEDFLRSMEDAFRAAMIVDLECERVIPPIPLVHDKHFMWKMRFSKGVVSVIIPFLMVEPICNAFEANFGIQEDFEAYSRALAMAVDLDVDNGGEQEQNSVLQKHKVIQEAHLEEAANHYRFIVDTELELRAELGPKSISVGQLGNLQKGDVIIFDADKNINLSTKDTVIFKGKIGYTGSATAVKIEQVVNRRKS